ncbi:MAG: class I tRNA ligase family protein, partial [Fidelibacterota bacterium]
FDLFEQYGTDAVRFGVMLMAPQGLDVLFTNSRLEVGRNFMNKLWNASRFVLMNLPEGLPSDSELTADSLDLPERWILSRLQQAIGKLNRQLDRFYFNEAAKVIYEFTWNDFCDWYVEIAKTRFRSNDGNSARAARAVAVHVLRRILAMLHPYAPFITEELWSFVRPENARDIIVSPWPVTEAEWIDAQAEEEMSLVRDVITAVRTIRGQMNVPPTRKADLVVRADERSAAILHRQEAVIQSLGSLATVTLDAEAHRPPQSASAVVQGLELFLPLEGLIDIELERERILKRQRELNGHLSGLHKKLENQKFLERAPREVVIKEQQKLADMTEEMNKLTANLELLE